MRELDQRGLHESVLREAKILLETSPPLGMGFDNAAAFGAKTAADRGDFATALSLLKLRMAALSAGKFWFRDRVGFLAIALHFHRASAGVALAAGDIPGMQRQMQACQNLDPIEIEFPIELVADLEKNGHRPEADALFGHAWEVQQKLCQQYPDSAYQHNQTAWLAAECNRELEPALEHAMRAVALEPKRSAYLDTLAEVHFRRGQIDLAISEMKQCLQMQPRNRQHLEHLARFEAFHR
jgi:tetratricopeptide (TPR) repeat protein